MNLNENVKVVLAKAAQAAGTTAVNTDVIDMTGYREITFFGEISTNNAGNYVKLQEDNASNGATAADLAGTKTGANKKYFKLTLVRPRKRYVRLVVTRGESSATGAIWALLSKASKAPVSSATDTLDEKTVVSPAAGTP